jgi:hypothetical protein
MLITSPEFTSNLTGKTYYTKSFEPLDCRTVCMVVNLLDDSNFHRQTAVMTRLIEMRVKSFSFFSAQVLTRYWKISLDFF